MGWTTEGQFYLPAPSSVALDLELRDDSVTLEDNDLQDRLWSTSSGGLGKLHAHSVFPSLRWNEKTAPASLGATDTWHREVLKRCHIDAGRARGCWCPTLSQASLLASL